MNKLQTILGRFTLAAAFVAMVWMTLRKLTRPLEFPSVFRVPRSVNPTTCDYKRQCSSLACCHERSVRGECRCSADEWKSSEWKSSKK